MRDFAVIVLGFIISLLMIAVIQAVSAREMPREWIEFAISNVIDGDTISGVAYPWPGVMIATSVRLRGIDTPEIRGKCDAERQKALLARDALKSITSGKSVLLTGVRLDKYAGRVVADVWVDDGNVSDKLLQMGLAQPYFGQGPKPDWCS